MYALNKLINLEPNEITFKRLKELSPIEFEYFCGARYTKDHSPNENIGEKLRGSFKPIHMAGWTNNIKALKLLVSLGANINSKSNNGSTVLDTFMDSILNDVKISINNPLILEKKLIDFQECIETLKNSKFNFNNKGYDRQIGIYRFVKHVTNHIDSFDKTEETEKCIISLIKNTNLDPKDTYDDFFINIITVLANSVKYFNKEMIDLVMSKEEFRKEHLPFTTILLCATNRNDWNNIKDSFNYLVDKYEMPLEPYNNNSDFIKRSIEYRHKPLFEIATKNATLPIDFTEILELSLTHCFKPGISYVKRKSLETLIDNKHMTEMANNVPTKLHMEKLIINAQYETMSKNLNSDKNTEAENNKKRFKI